MVRVSSLQPRQDNGSWMLSSDNLKTIWNDFNERTQFHADTNYSFIELLIGWWKSSAHAGASHFLSLIWSVSKLWYCWSYRSYTRGRYGGLFPVNGYSCDLQLRKMLWKMGFKQILDQSVAVCQRNTWRTCRLNLSRGCSTSSVKPVAHFEICHEG